MFILWCKRIQQQFPRLPFDQFWERERNHVTGRRVEQRQQRIAADFLAVFVDVDAVAEQDHAQTLDPSLNPGLGRQLAAIDIQPGDIRRTSGFDGLPMEESPTAENRLFTAQTDDSPDKAQQRFLALI